MNGEIEYKLDSSALNYNKIRSLFKVDSQTGRIFLKSEIYREQNDTISLSLIASDKGTPQSKSTLVDLLWGDVWGIRTKKFKIQNFKLTFHSSCRELNSKNNGLVNFIKF